MKIYTKTGDQGQTSLVGGKRVNKACTRLESYGTIDELNSFIGLLITQCAQPADKQMLTNIQNTLFVVGGYLATDNTQGEANAHNIVTAEMVGTIEQQIDTINAQLPPLKHFVLPGGTQAASLSHVCRTVCRRAERRILALREEGAEVDENVMAYINRLSDYFFTLSRKLNIDEKQPEIIWQKEK